MERSDIDEVLRKRYWLRDNFDWLIQEVTFHKEMRRNYSDRKTILWKYGEPEGKAIIQNEAAE